MRISSKQDEVIFADQPKAVRLNLHQKDFFDFGLLLNEVVPKSAISVIHRIIRILVHPRSNGAVKRLRRIISMRIIRSNQSRIIKDHTASYRIIKDA